MFDVVFFIRDLSNYDFCFDFFVLYVILIRKSFCLVVWKVRLGYRLYFGGNRWMVGRMDYWVEVGVIVYRVVFNGIFVNRIWS